MAIAEVYGSGTTTVKGDTRRILYVKKLRVLGDTPLRSDTARMLKGKIDQKQKGLTVKNNF